MHFHAVFADFQNIDIVSKVVILLCAINRHRIKEQLAAAWVDNGNCECCIAIFFPIIDARLESDVHAICVDITIHFWTDELVVAHA